MKGVCILLFCMAAVAFAYFEDEEVNLQERAGETNSKRLPGGYTFITKSVGGGKYDCKCERNGSPVWAGMCGVKDKGFSYSDCV